MIYEVIEKDPYLGHELPDNSKGLVIKSQWDNRFIDLIKENNLKYLYLNYAHGWKCEDYSFLHNLPPVLGIRILDVHSKGIHALESQKWLKSISLNVRIDENINFENFEKLEDCFLGWSKKAESILQVTHIKDLYIDRFRKSHTNEISNLVNLEKLTIGNSNITSVEFLKNMPHLKTLELLNCRKVESFKPVSGLVGLERLSIRGYKDIHDINFLKELVNLEVLLLEVGKINSIEVLKDLRKLKAFSFSGSKTTIIDGNLEVLTKLPLLSMLMFGSRRHYSHKLIKPWSWNNFDQPDKLLEKK